MKKIFLLASLAAFQLVSVKAQTPQSGIYLSEAAFETNKLSYAVNDESETNKIRFNEFLDKPYITVRHNGEKIKMFKGDIFAYKNKDKIVFTRHLTSYNFVEKGVIWIFYKDQNVALGKGIIRDRSYYYAVAGKGEIMPLTRNNLKESFAGYNLFHNFLDAQFRKDEDLSLYDSYAKKYKVNHLLEKTIFETARN